MLLAQEFGCQTQTFQCQTDYFVPYLDKIKLTVPEVPCLNGSQNLVTKKD
jgi:hypothetical protein